MKRATRNRFVKIAQQLAEEKAREDAVRRLDRAAAEQANLLQLRFLSLTPSPLSSLAPSLDRSPPHSFPPSPSPTLPPPLPLTLRLPPRAAAAGGDSEVLSYQAT